MLFLESVKKDPNMPCEEGRIEMSKIDVHGSILHCSKLRKIRIRSQVFFLITLPFKAPRLRLNSHSCKDLSLKC